MSNNNINNLFVSTFYDAAEDAAAQAAAQAAADAAKAAADAKAAEAAKTATTSNNTRTYTQDEVERMIQAEKTRADELARKAVAELETHKKNATLTVAQKEALQKQIDELNAQVMTKEQLSKQELEKLVNKYEADLKMTSTERDTWKERFSKSTVQRALSDAAAKHDAYDVEMFLALLSPKTQVVEEKDEQGNIKDFKVKVKYDDRDKDGKPIVLDLDPDQAVKQMKDNAQKYGYLFKGHINPGVRGQASTGGLKNVDVTNMTPAEYAKYRKEILT
jgi:hypothetical protein